jgi:protein N-lysine methyltransferase METTL21A
MADRELSSSPEFSPLAFGEDFAPLPVYKPAGTTKVDFAGLLGEPLKLHEDLKSGCGGQLWPAGLVLAKHMLRYHREKLQHAKMSVTGPIS